MPCARRASATTAPADGSTRLDFTGDRAAAPGAAPNLIASLRQSLAPESADTDYVDFGTSDVFAVFNIYPASCGAGCTGAPAWTSGSVPVDNRMDWGDTGTGFAQVARPSGLIEGAYVVTVSLVSNGYIVGRGRASSPLTVASPGERFVTGSGSVPDGQFSFDVKGAKTGLKGSSVYTYRTSMDGHDVVVTITSAGLTALSTGTATTFPMAAFVTGGAVVQVVDAVTGQRYTALEPEGARFRLDLTDKGNSGKTDTYGFTTYRSGRNPVPPGARRRSAAGRDRFPVQPGAASPPATWRCPPRGWPEEHGLGQLRAASTAACRPGSVATASASPFTRMVGVCTTPALDAASVAG